MKMKKIKILSWNVRGLGDVKKGNTVCNLIRESRCDIVCLQETKWNRLDVFQYARVLPNYFDRDWVGLNAIHSAGGCIIAWRRNYTLINSWVTRHTCSAILRQESTGQVFVVSNVYGPSVDELKPNFVEELRKLADMISLPWICLGDFNISRWLEDRPGDIRAWPIMDLFNSLISELQLCDVPLKNRRYTWTSKRPDPSFSKIDRVFMTTDWSLCFPVITLTALEMVVSDHVPLLLTCKQRQTKATPYRLEKFWFKYPEVRNKVRDIWQQTDMNRRLQCKEFDEKIKRLHHELRAWHKLNFGKMEEQLVHCKNAISFFDKIEERRLLDERERSLRTKIREKAFELANIIELRWQQRARCKWLSQGDRNTAYFHAYASARSRKNLVLSIEEGGRVITDEDRIQRLFFDHMKEIMGATAEAKDFNPRELYPTEMELSHLVEPFTEEEVHGAVKQLASNKASGPDGIPNEFIKEFWHEIKEDLLKLLHSFYEHSLDLSEMNRGNMVMIPKKKDANVLRDFRPISVINALPKLIAKILANRLSTRLPELISPNQTAFVRGRYIAENFLVTRELLHHIEGTNRQTVFAKIDFSKAFDTLHWGFLIKVMKCRGFPARWIAWITNLLTTATSSVVINGNHSEFFNHTRGLRQGDPLSPLLFILAVDVLQRMVQAVSTLVRAPISPTIRESIISLHYVDDTAFIVHAELGVLATFKIVLRLFSGVSGLLINYTKSAIIPLT